MREDSPESPREYFSALEDQQCAAALMWTCVTMIYLMPAAILAMRLLAAGGLPEDELA